LADVSTVLTGGAALAPKAGEVAQVLQKGANITNPLSVVPAAVKTAGWAVKNTLGPTTGAGSEAISEAAKAVYSLSKTGKPNSFWENLTGKVPMTDVIDEVKRGVQILGKQKGDAYRANMAGIKSDKTILALDKVDDAVSNAFDMTTYKGQIKNTRAAEVVKKISDTVDEWKNLPPNEFHTPEGLDALKQKIGGIVESIPFEEKTARTAANGVYHAIKGEISRQAPTYAKTMKDYSDATDMIREVEKSLSVGNKTSADTTMRKLQSLMRNNVNTNYGNRLDMARDIQARTGVDFMPDVAGEALNSWASRGLAGSMENLGTLGAAAAMQNPWLLGALPFQSPKLMGGASYLGGRAAGYPAGWLTSAGVTPQGVLTGGLLSGEIGKPVLESKRKQANKRDN
jgi:predicted RNA-binding protein with EMAP domain